MNKQRMYELVDVMEKSKRFDNVQLEGTDPYFRTSL
jgi:hypothetical protein